MNYEIIKKFIYKYLVDNHPLISKCFRKYLVENYVAGGYGHKFLYILKLNIQYRLFRKQGIDKELSKLKMPECCCDNQLSDEEMINKVSKADLISFDIFDTLIVRAVENPYDVFRILEARNGIIHFANMRQKAEEDARAIKKKKAGNTEVTIYEIYDVLSKTILIDKENAIQEELEVEKMICYANPYMKQIYDSLLNMGKKIIITSDMYLTSEILRELLLVNGYSGFDRIFVSCEYGVSKENGMLQKLISAEYNNKMTVCHIGDNIFSDYKGSKQAGWDALEYKNVNCMGSPYRRWVMDSIAASIYKGIVNVRLHCGGDIVNPLYEYGYVYGGLIAVGYCQFIRNYVKYHNIEQLLFLARDGYIIEKIYKEYDTNISTVYVPFSRFASYELTMDRYYHEFLRHIVRPRYTVTPKETIDDIMRICDMPWLERYLDRYGLKHGQEFSVDVYQIIEKIFEDNIEEIVSYYDDTSNAAKKYFEKIIEKNKNVCVVDIGWQGTGALCLKYFLEQKCGLNVNVTGVLLGMLDGESTQIASSVGILEGYVCSPKHNGMILNNIIGKRNEIDYKKLMLEIMFTEDKETFVKFYNISENEIGFLYGSYEDNRDSISQIQNGIYDFACDYRKYDNTFGMMTEFSGQEVMVPISDLSCSKKFIKSILGDYQINDLSGIYDNSEKVTFSKVI